MIQKEFNDVIISQTERCKSMLVENGAEYVPRAAKGCPYGNAVKTFGFRIG